MINNYSKIMSNEILYVLLLDYAAHEAVYLAQAIASDEFALKENPKYVNKVVAPTLEPVRSIGGFRTVPDYSFDTMPDDYAALVLIGGFGWMTPVADRVVPIVRRAVEQGGVSVKGEKVTDIKASYTKDMIGAEEFIVKKGKKSFKKIVVE